MIETKGAWDIPVMLASIGLPAPPSDSPGSVWVRELVTVMVDAIDAGAVPYVVRQRGVDTIPTDPVDAWRIVADLQAWRFTFHDDAGTGPLPDLACRMLQRVSTGVWGQVDRSVKNQR